LLLAAPSIPGGSKLWARAPTANLALPPQRSRHNERPPPRHRPEADPAVFRTGRKDNNAAETSCKPSVLRFPRTRTNPTSRLRRGVSGRTSIFSAGMCPAPRDRVGTIEAPSPTATTLFIASTLSNSINGRAGGPASASQSVIIRRSADFSLPRIRGTAREMPE
jgi:hypothetical protein